MKNLECLIKLSLFKGDEKFFFNCNYDNINNLIDYFFELADNKNINFSWLDAFIMSYQLGKIIMQKEKEYILKR